MSTSGTYSFQSPQNVDLITDAIERIGIYPDTIVPRQIISAQRTANFILQSWINKGLNLFTVQQNMIGLTTGKGVYNLPPNTSDVLEATIRTSNRNLGGTASASSGVAQNAFDGNPFTACTQNAPNGYIAYTWGAPVFNTIQLVGVQSNATLDYTLSFEYSLDEGVTWLPLSQGNAPIQSYPVGQIIWFVVPVPVPSNGFRILETGGATLNIQELYFDNLVYDTIITRVSREDYNSYPNKNLIARPSLYWVDRQVNPTITLWPTPSDQYNNLFLSTVKMIEDFGTMQNNVAIPARFLDALTWDLAYRLCLKEPDRFDAQRISILKQETIDSYKIAAEEDTDNYVPIRIYGNFMTGWTQSP